MKRLSFLLLAITLTFVAACQPDEKQNRNANANANANANISVNANQNVAPPTSVTDKVVQIYIYDDPKIQAIT